MNCIAFFIVPWVNSLPPQGRFAGLGMRVFDISPRVTYNSVWAAHLIRAIEP
jgi:hypothetical protein